MPLFRLLRQERLLSKETRPDGSFSHTIITTFQPIIYRRGNVPLYYSAESPEAAWETVKKDWPGPTFHHRLFALEEVRK